MDEDNLNKALLRLGRQKTNIRVGLTTVIALLAGSAVLIVGATFREELDAGSIRWFDLVSAVGSSIMAIGILALVFEISTRRAIMDEVLNRVALKEDINFAGLVAMPQNRTDSRAHLKKALLEAKKVDLVYVSSGWVESNTEALSACLRERGARVRILLPNPDASELLKELLARLEYTNIDDLRRAVGVAKYAAFKLREMHPAISSGQGIKSGVEIRWLPVVPPYALFRVGSRGTLEFYEMRKERDHNSPNLQFSEPGALARFAEADFEAIWKNADRATSGP